MSQVLMNRAVQAVEASRLRRYQRLVEVARDLTSTLDLDTLLLHIIRTAAELSGAEAASILLYDERVNALYFQAASNLDAPFLRGINIPLEGSVAGWVVKNRLPALITDVHHDARFFDGVDKGTNHLTRSLIAVPLLNQDKVVGVLEVLNKTEGDFSMEDQEILITLGAQAAVAIMNARLFQQSDQISELVHELRTPLSSLTTAAYLLQRPDVSEEQRLKLANSIYSESRRLNDLATSFLDLARLESGRTALQVRSFDLRRLLEECREIVLPRAEELGVTLELRLREELPNIDADRDKIKQVFLNLLSNGIKYNRPEGRLTVTTNVCDENFTIAFQDTGIGIEPDDMRHLFQKFFRARGSERASGTGLGLSICRRIVEAHRGRIEVTSQPDQGTTFTVWLPMANPKS